eukprot:2608169-Pyramimonas_sp.AAC.1
MIVNGRSPTQTTQKNCKLNVKPRVFPDPGMDRRILRWLVSPKRGQNWNMVRDIMSGRGFANNRASDRDIREHGSGRGEIKT